LSHDFSAKNLNSNFRRKFGSLIFRRKIGIAV